MHLLLLQVSHYNLWFSHPSLSLLRGVQCGMQYVVSHTTFDVGGASTYCTVLTIHSFECLSAAKCMLTTPHNDVAYARKDLCVLLMTHLIFGCEALQHSTSIRLDKNRTISVYM